MTISVTTAGTGASNTSTTSLAFNCGTTFAVGDMIVVIAAADNAGTSGARSLTTITDVKSHTYTFFSNILIDPGAASAGAQLVIAYAEVTSAMVATDQITLNFSAATVAKSAQVYKMTKTGVSWNAATTYNNSGTGSTANPAVTTGTASGDPPVGAVVFAAAAIESTAAGTGDSDTTNGTWSTLSSIASGGTMRCYSQYKVQTTTASSQTWNLTVAAADWAVGIVAFTEYAPPYMPPLPFMIPTTQAVRRAASW